MKSLLVSVLLVWTQLGLISKTIAADQLQGDSAWIG